MLDTDSDGIADHIDIDDDGDGLRTLDEDLNANGDPTDDDKDQDGTANYLESMLLDADSDGVVDQSIVWMMILTMIRTVMTSQKMRPF